MHARASEPPFCSTGERDVTEGDFPSKGGGTGQSSNNQIKWGAAPGSQWAAASARGGRGAAESGSAFVCRARISKA